MVRSFAEFAVDLSIPSYRVREGISKDWQ